MIDPNADIVIAVSPTTLLDPNRYLCEVCYRGFSREQNLTLHRRAHNLPFSLKAKAPTDPVPRKVYLCPEPTCIHHNRSHALGDFGGLKKHYLRKHCSEKNYKCDTCFKAYSVESDLRAHSKVCAKKKYICHCGSKYSRFCRGHHSNVHQENYDARGHIDAAIAPQTLVNMGEGSSANYTRHNSNIPFPMLGMGENTTRINSNQNSNPFIGTPISSIQTQSTFYPHIAPNESHLCQFRPDHSTLMTNPSMGLNFVETPPPFFPSQSTHLNQHGCQENFDVGLYADILMDRVPLHNVNLDMSLGGDCGNIYGYGEGSNSVSDGGFMVDPSSSLNLTNAMQNTSVNGMLNPLAGSSDGGGYEQGGYGGYSGYDEAGPGGGSLAPSEEQLNHHGFWF
ncbi:hypothetical protein SSX86_007058 [Deinandra increscens subsp. villosa]|uniref:C2H2-type domain-containing protein n=1 Tax=Deinandra increscens subsp. villosa TaxID=3103831 RepID=A0AAP0H9A5_9ASTR